MPIFRENKEFLGDRMRIAWGLADLEVPVWTEISCSDWIFFWMSAGPSVSKQAHLDCNGDQFLTEH
jgi:hypothetical protein